MVENKQVPPLPLISENEYCEHAPWSFTTLSGSSSVSRGERMGFSTFRTALLQTPPGPPSLERGCLISHPKLNEVVAPNPIKRPRGRPLGAKNKTTKPTLVKREDFDNTPKFVLVEIPRGNDVAETLINFAHYHNANITVLGGSGLVSDISLVNPMSLSSAFPIIGTFSLMSLVGTYINADCGRAPPQFITNHVASPFSIYIAGAQGQVFGGIVAGKVMSAGSVLVTASLFKNDEFHKVEYVNGCFREVITNSHHTQVDTNDNNGSNNNTIVGSTLDVAGSNSAPLNRQLNPPSPNGVNQMECNHSTPADSY